MPLVHDYVSHAVLPLEGEHLIPVFVLKLRSVAEFDGKLIAIQHLRTMRDVVQVQHSIEKPRRELE